MSVMPAPLFILAAPYSGASYLAGQLDGHSQLYALPELCLFMADEVGELLDIFRLSQGPHADGLLRAVAQLEFGAQTDAEIGGARDWLQQRRQWAVGELLATLASRAAPRRLVIPDTESPLRPMDLRRLRRHVPGAGVIHLLRHPWSQGCLLAGWARERLFVPADFKDHGWTPQLVDPQIPWLRANRNIERLLVTMTHRWQRVQVEALDLQPRETLAHLCSGLDLTLASEDLRRMLAPNLWRFAAYGPGTAPYGLEAEVLEPIAADDLALAAQPSLSAPLPWRPDQSAFAPEVVAQARSYGYS